MQLLCKWENGGIKSVKFNAISALMISYGPVRMFFTDMEPVPSQPKQVVEYKDFQTRGSGQQLDMSIFKDTKVWS